MFKVNNKNIVNFLTYFTLCSSVSIVNFDYVIAGWEVISLTFVDNADSSLKFEFIFSSFILKALYK